MIRLLVLSSFIFLNASTRSHQSFHNQKLLVTTMSSTSFPTNYSTPVNTVKTFLKAALEQDTSLALSCLNKQSIQKGRHGISIEKLLMRFKELELETTRFLTYENKVSIEASWYSMDFELNQEGKKWVIVSIHP